MKILHYSLGLPPYRSGGLTKYSIDLMKEQVNQDNEVMLLFPGVMTESEVKITYYRRYEGVTVYELKNPLPVSLMNGISNPKIFMKKCNKEVFYDFFKKENIDVVHIHSLMGLYKEFLEVCNEFGIKVVYTSHDYFGICTKVNFLDYNNKVCENRDLEKCLLCNSKGDDIKKIRILQSKEYRWLKDKGIIAALKNSVIKLKKYKNAFSKDNNDAKENFKPVNREEYIELLQYYNDMFSKINKFFFNSEVAKNLYSKYIDSDSEVISITHSDIKDNRVIKKYDNNKLKLTYLGPNEIYKGYNLIIDVMDVIYKEFSKNISLEIYGKINSVNEIERSNIKINGTYKYSDLKNIFKNTDVLIVPSIWYETFGFITLEALSYGVPVIVTEKVGSKDLLDINHKAKGIVVKDDIQEIVDVIKNIYSNKYILSSLNENIFNSKFNLTMPIHSEEIIKLYKKL
ncbi:glycosyltransferase [uncultured Clostridium sp.]|uniref:glycosyltransferase n=1 Tax=uncultured Clostridium sp. TaxID=59620 RepID=UPI002591D45D|nr:glycosyltransferase [uncultured Clostridium sp.]